ncbi:MAG: hypothetical protein R2827_06015 [Bdellovibrionales bacterium]
MKQNYSFARASSLVSKDYRPMPAQMAQAGENSTEFGFFLTEKPVFDASNNEEQRDIQLINRWNPNRRVITYYLGQNFNEPRKSSAQRDVLSRC